MVVKIILHALLAALRSRRRVALENIALRHQLDVLQRTAKRPPLKPWDRAIWAVLSRSLPDWREHLAIVQPDTRSSAGTAPAGGSSGAGEADLVEVGRRSLPRSEP
jgi:hypothetical protein